MCTNVSIATISKPNVSINIIASNVVMHLTSFRLELYYPPSVEASPESKKSVPPSCVCVVKHYTAILLAKQV